jgi:glycosyltransferase involved in cell wall biosynthesis
MRILVSTQNHLEFKGGIRKFIKKYSYNSKDNIYLISRKNPQQTYYIDGKEIKNLKKEVKKLKIDEAHIHSFLDSGRYFGLIDLFKELKIPVTYFCHSLIKEEIENEECFNELHYEKQLAQQELFEKADKIIFFNNYHRDKCIQENIGIKNKSIVQYHTTEKKNVKIVKTDKNNILYVGRLSKEKGILDLVRAYKNIANYKTNLIIVGALPEDLLLPEIKSILQGTNHQIINWIDNEKELSQYYQQASLVVLPSHYDSFNMVGIEALAHGVPLLVSDIPVFREIYPNEIFFQSKNVINLSKKLISNI